MHGFTTISPRPLDIYRSFSQRVTEKVREKEVRAFVVSVECASQLDRTRARANDAAKPFHDLATVKEFDG